MDSGRGQEGLWDDFYRSNGRAWRGSCRLPDPLGGGRALDIGCGSGKSASSLMDMGYDVSGVDLSAEAVAICAARFGPDRFAKGDVLGLPFGDGAFDYAVAVHVLEHIPDSDMPLAASEILRVLRPGGYLFVRDFAPGDLREGRREGSGIEYHHRTPEGIAGLLGGFRVLESGIVEERTRFGAVRRRSELLLVRPGPRCVHGCPIDSW